MHLLFLLVLTVNIIISWKGFKDGDFFDRYAFDLNAVKRGQHWRMWTSGWLHVDSQHLIFNMFTLYFFAPIVIQTLGSIAFLVGYLGSLYAGSWLSYQIHKNQPTYHAVGASGAVTGILYTSIALYPDMQLGILFIPIPFSAYWVGFFYMMYTFYGVIKNNDRIGHTAHFGGAIFGLILPILMTPKIVEQHLGPVTLMLLPVLVFFIWAYKRR
jgi:membrane associated rhomboid family serine protease